MPQDLLQDLQALRNKWQNICEQLDKVAAPAELFHELDMLPRMIRDVFTEQVQECIVNTHALRQQVIHAVEQFAPKLSERIIVLDNEDVFEKYQIQEELDRLFARKIWLDNGAYIVVEHTEALTVIDVNTGKYTGTTDLEQTVFETNLAAARLIAQLIRLRDIGGIVIVDFIDMNEEQHREQIVQELEEIMKGDRTKSLIMGWTRLCLLEITRKKVRDSVDRFGTVCTYCGGSGRLYTK